MPSVLWATHVFPFIQCHLCQPADNLLKSLQLMFPFFYVHQYLQSSKCIHGNSEWGGYFFLCYQLHFLYVKITFIAFDEWFFFDKFDKGFVSLVQWDVHGLWCIECHPCHPTDGQLEGLSLLIPIFSIQKYLH